MRAMGRVLLAANVPAEENGGVANVLRAHAAGLRALHPDCQVEHVPGGVSWAAYQWRCLRWWWRRPGRPAAIIGHGADGVALLALGRLLGVPRLITVWHGFAVTCDRVLRKAGCGPQIPRRQYWTAWLSLRLARSTFVLSRADRLWLRVAWGLPAAVLPQGRPDGPAPRRQPARRAATALFLGHPSERKGFDRFVACSADVDLRFVHIGARVWSAGLGRVESLGPMAQARVAAYLVEEAVVVVAPSRYEGSPLAVVEALCAGRPVLTTGWGGQRDLLRGTGMYLREPGGLRAGLGEVAANYDAYCARAAEVAAGLPMWVEVARLLWGPEASRRGAGA